MTLLFCDSFDYYEDAYMDYKWNLNGGATTTMIWPSVGRNGTYGWSPYSGATGWDDRYESGLWIPGGALSTVIVGCAVTIDDAIWTDYDSPVFNLYDSGTLQLGVWYDASATKWIVVNGALSILGTASPIITAYAWYYIELKAIIHNTNGGVWLRVNGVDEVKLGAYADTPVGLDTSSTANNSCNQFYLGGSQGSDHRNRKKTIDDLYICDTNGSVNNDFLGDVTVQALLPNGAGNYSQWTPTAGANYTNVDESNPPNDTDFVSASASGLRDSYAFANLSGTNTVYGVQQTTLIKKTTSGARSVRQFSRLSSTDMDLGSAATAMPGGYLMLRDIAETKPGGGSWTNTDVNDAEFGIRTVT